MLYIPIRLFKPGSRWLTLLLLLAVAGCGFQLRGALELSDSISPVYIESGGAFELAREIKALLEKNQVTIADSPAVANSGLMVLGENASRRVLSVDSSGRASEYLLIYQVNLNISIGQAKATPDSVSLSRSMVFDPDAVLAATNEAEILYRDMRKDAARLVLLKLQSRAVRQQQAVTGESAVNSAPHTDGTTAGQLNGGTQ